MRWPILLFLFALTLFATACKDGSNLSTETEASSLALSSLDINSSDTLAALSLESDRNLLRDICRGIAKNIMEEGKWDGVTIKITCDGTFVEPYNVVIWDGVSSLKPGVTYGFENSDEAKRAHEMTKGYPIIIDNITKKKDSNTPALASGQWFADVDHFQTGMCSFAIESYTENPSHGYGTTIYHAFYYFTDGYLDNCDWFEGLWESVSHIDCLNPNGCGGMQVWRYRFYKCPMDVDWQWCGVGYLYQDPQAEDEDEGNCSAPPPEWMCCE